MKVSALSSTLFVSVTVTLASPVAAEKAVGILPCSPGHIYCGWTLIDQFGWSSEIMRQDLCNKIGDCADNWGHPWDSLWKCNSQFQADPIKFCGGAGSCKPNNIGC